MQPGLRFATVMVSETIREEMPVATVPTTDVVLEPAATEETR
jgi:hypothetical protein